MTNITTRTLPGIIHLMDSARGVFIPRDFASLVTADNDLPNAGKWSGIDKEDLQILSCGPDHELYWEVWAAVLDNTTFTALDGAEYHLHQDGDLWMVCSERMTLEEQRDLLGAQCAEDYATPDDCTLYEINSYFVPALYYGDITGLSDEEAEQIAAFIEENGDNVVDSIEFDEFGECCITGLRGRTSLVLIRNPEPTV